MNLAIPSPQTPLISYQHLIITRNYLRVYDHEPVDLSTQHQALTLEQIGTSVMPFSQHYNNHLPDHELQL